VDDDLLKYMLGTEGSPDYLLIKTRTINGAQFNLGVKPFIVPVAMNNLLSLGVRVRVSAPVNFNGPDDEEALKAIYMAAFNIEYDKADGVRASTEFYQLLNREIHHAVEVAEGKMLPDLVEDILSRLYALPGEDEAGILEAEEWLLKKFKGELLPEKNSNEVPMNTWVTKAQIKEMMDAHVTFSQTYNAIDAQGHPIAMPSKIGEHAVKPVTPEPAKAPTPEDLGYSDNVVPLRPLS
jgi:hypothetical protein